jgi:hypothetical protein
MSINKILSALALGLALAACSGGEKTPGAAQDANANTAAPASAAPPATAAPAAAAPSAASTPATAAAANPVNTAAPAATDATAQASSSAAMASSASSDAVHKAADDVIQSQDTNMAGFTADLIEAKRSDNVLSIKIRVKNTGAKADNAHFTYGHKIDDFYVQAEDKKYFVLRDAEKVPVADGVDYTSVEPGASYTWWAKYPAPPATIRKFNYYWPLGPPWDDVPITDK